MNQAKADILIHLARQAIYNITRGECVVLIHDKHDPELLKLYESLHHSRYVRKKKTTFGPTYQLTKRGWNRLTQGQKDKMLVEYEDWVEKFRPTIAGPEWLDWI